MNIVVVFLILHSIWINQCYAKNDDDVGNANQFADEILANFRKEPTILSEIEPLIIPDVKNENFEIWNGTVTGLSSLYRYGDCTLYYKDTIIKVTVEVAIRDLIVDTKYRAKALFFWIKGHATLKVDDLAVNAVVRIEDGKARIESFTVTKLGKYKMKKITGTSKALNWLLKLIVNAVAKNSRKKITSTLENQVASAVNDLLANYELPKVKAMPPKLLNMLGNIFD